MPLFQSVLSPLAESFLVLMILAAYSWPVQSLTQRRTTEKAPLGSKDRGQEEEMGQLCQHQRGISAIRLTSQHMDLAFRRKQMSQHRCGGTSLAKPQITWGMSLFEHF